jgi:hypothetical protein
MRAAVAPLTPLGLPIMAVIFISILLLVGLIGTSVPISYVKNNRCCPYYISHPG